MDDFTFKQRLQADRILKEKEAVIKELERMNESMRADVKYWQQQVAKEQQEKKEALEYYNENIRTYLQLIEKLTQGGTNK